MAKITLNPVQSGFYSTALLNQNFADIEAAIENTLSRDGTTPNSMNADLDMNNNDVINVNSISAQDVSIRGTSIYTVFTDIIAAKDSAVAAAASADISEGMAASYAAQANSYAAQANASEASAEILVQAAVSGFQGFTDGVGYDFGVVYDNITYFNRDFGSIV